MGCDIHCYIEYRSAGEKRWAGFGGRINPGRNYGVFARLAGVRTGGQSDPAPKGRLTDMGWDAEHDDQLHVNDEAPHLEGVCSSAKAAEWVAAGYSEYVGDGQRWVTNPDYHSHSWATTDEWVAATKGVNLPKYRAILDVMRSFEEQGYEARVVYWFDN